MNNTMTHELCIGQQVVRFGEHATVTRITPLSGGDWLLGLRFEHVIELPCGEWAQRVDARASEVLEVTG